MTLKQTNVLTLTDKDLRRRAEQAYATLSPEGTVPDEQVPGQVTDVLNYESKDDFPKPGDPSRYYRSDETGKTYKYDEESAKYVEVVVPTAAVTSVAGRTGAVTLTKTDVGLANVVNTGDSATPAENGTTKFTTGGAYAELARKADKAVPSAAGNVATLTATGHLSDSGKSITTSVTENSTALVTSGAVWSAIDAIDVSDQLTGKLDSAGQAVDFAKTTAYAVDKIVRHEGKLYRCKAAVTAANTATPDEDTTHWTAMKLSTDFTTIVKLTEPTETMASILARLNTINDQGQHVQFDVSAIESSPMLYLCTIFIDTTAGVVRIADAVTGKLYIGVYDASQTIANALSKAVDAYVTIVVSATTADGVTVTGQTVSLYEGADASTGTLRETASYEGQPVSFLVPRGTEYFVQITSTLAGHFSPSTAHGNANANTFVTLTYQDASSITDFAGIQGFIRQEGMTAADAKTAILGKEIEDTWTSDNGTTVITNPMVVVDVKNYKDADGNSHLGVKLRRKYATYDMQFDAAESPVLCDSSTETTAESGLGYYGWAAAFDASKTYALNSYCSYDGVAYKCILAKSTADSTTPDNDSEHFAVQATMVKGSLVWLGLSAGQSLPYSGYLEIYKHGLAYNARDAFSYGSNRYDHSAVRQYINSSASELGGWWTSQHAGDVAPSQLSTTRGYMAGCTSALLDYIQPVQVQCYSGQADIVTTVDKFFLDSGAEMNGSVNDNENTADSFWVAAMDNAAANNNASTARIQYRQTAKTSACTLWLRSPSRSVVSHVWYVGTGGSISSYNVASNSYGLAPACVIY